MAQAEGLNAPLLMEDLAEVSDWHLLGSSLGLETSQLNVIEKDVPAGIGATDQRKSQVVHTWMKGKSGDPSWRDVVTALNKMGEHNVAEKIRRKYSGSVTVQTQNEGALEIARENEHKLRGLFAKLVQLVSTKLQAMPIDLDKFSSMVKHYFSCADCIPIPGNVEEIFLAVGRNELWDFMNYSPLQVISDAFCDDDSDLQQAFQEYRVALAGYRVSTKVVHYFATRNQFSEEAYFSDGEQTVARRDQRYFVKLSIKLKAKATEKSLQYLTELWERVSEYLLLPALPYLLDEIMSGSILVVWLVPRSIILALIIKCKQPSAAKFFAGYDICNLTVDNLVLYEEKVEEVEDSSIKQSPDSQEQVKKESSPDIATDTTQLLDSFSTEQSPDSQEPVENEPSPHIATDTDSSIKQSPDSQKQESSEDIATHTAILEQIQDSSSMESLQHEKEKDEWCESQLELFQDILGRERMIRKRIEKEIDELRSTNAYNEVKIGQLEEELTKLECKLSQTREEQQQTTEASAEELTQLREELVRDELNQARKETLLLEQQKEIDWLREVNLHLMASTRGLRRNKEQEEIQSPSTPDPSGPSHTSTELHPGVGLQWRKCADAPVGQDRPQVVVEREKVYVGGGDTIIHGSGAYRIFQYNLRRDTWSTLPRCPVRWFGMAYFMGRIITVGGEDLQNSSIGDVLSLSEESQQWEAFLTPMPTARCGLSVTTTANAVIAAGGRISTSSQTRSSAVEVYSSDTSQWHTADPLPIPYAWMSSVTINDIWYLLGGSNSFFRGTKDCWCTSLHSLVHKAVSRSISGSVWNHLPPTPLRWSAAACLSGSLVAVGGENDDNNRSSAVYAFLNNSWVRLINGDLLPSRSGCATAQLSPVEVIIIGDEQPQQAKTLLIGTVHSQ